METETTRYVIPHQWSPIVRHILNLSLRFHTDKGPYEYDTTEGWWEKWCHGMYFADQMVDKSWVPRQVFA